MCGIIGIAAREPVDQLEWLKSGRDLMRSRGPDDSGDWRSADGRVALAHRRLSILDLSRAGHQPMRARGGEACIVFNGEIYNFLELRAELSSKGANFYSHSDTEVILAAYREWGVECLARLNGMFAFALYDARRDLLFMARDRAGEKPLFYRLDDRAIRFSSELKGLMADPAFERQIDPHSLDIYLAEGYVPGGRCILQGVNKLPPAHALTFELNSGRSRCWRYWDLPEWDETANLRLDEEALVDKLETLLEDAVRRQLVADVPVGVLLSGGVDSSLVTAMATRATPNVRTFTIRFPGHGRHDETEHARLIARHFGTEHLELEAEAGTVDLLPRLARQFDEPLIDSSMIPTYLVSRLVRQHCTVALGGDGGDELFGGYSHYNRLLWLERRVGAFPRALRGAIAGAARHALPPGIRGRNWWVAMGTDFRTGLPLIASYFDVPARKRLLGNRFEALGSAEEIRESRIPEAGDLLQRATRMDFENYLPEDILVKVDRASMLHSLEVRAPMLDVHMIEFAFGEVPSHLKTTHDSRKVLLKKLAARLLPPEFDQQRKQGFSIPLDAWLRSGPWREFSRDVLLDESQTTFDRRFVATLLDGQKRRSNGERLFGLVMFELWRREYDVAL